MSTKIVKAISNIKLFKKKTQYINHIYPFGLFLIFKIKFQTKVIIRIISYVYE